MNTLYLLGEFMIKLLNYGDVGLKKWIFYDKKNSSERNKVFTRDFKNVISARFEYLPLHAKNGYMDASLSYLFYDSSGDRLLISEAPHSSKNRYVIFVSFVSEPGDKVLQINKYAAKEHYKSIVVEDGKTYYNMIYTLENCSGFVAFYMQDKTQVVFCWDEAKRVQHLCKYKKALYGDPNISDGIYLPNKDKHARYLKDRWQLAITIRDSIKKKAVVLAILYRFKYEADAVNQHFKLTIKQGYFILNAKSYYFSFESLQKIKDKYSFKTSINSPLGEKEVN